MNSFIVVFSIEVLTVNVIKEEHARSVVAWKAFSRRNSFMLVNLNAMVFRRNCRATHVLIFIFIFPSEPSHVLISNFTLLRLVEFPLTIYWFTISNRGTGNTFIDLLSVLVSVSLFRKQCILERIALNIECFKLGFATRRISTGILKS